MYTTDVTNAQWNNNKVHHWNKTVSLKPGCSEIAIAPQLGGLEKRSSATYTVKGPIHTSLALINNKLNVKIDLPDGISGIFK